MERMKKDGTPAKKPGPKAKKSGMDNTTTVTVEEKLKARAEAEPTAVKLTGPVRIETPEEHHVDIVETPEAPKTVHKPKQPLTYEGFKVCCIENNYGRFYWDCDHNHLDWTTGEGEEVSFTPQGWVTFCKYVMPKVMEILGV